MTRFWHPFADMGAVASRGEFVIDRGEGVYLYDEAGRRYLDATASLWYCNVGHGRAEIADAVARQIRKLETYSTFGDLANRPILDLAERVAAVAPVSDSVVFFTSGGSDSIDTAAKLARRYWSLCGEPERMLVIGRERAYHGMHAYGTSLGGIEANVAGYGQLVGDVLRVPWDSAEALAAVIEGVGRGRVAAFFLEPIIGAGGVLAPPEGYLAAVQEVCRETGVLLVADEVICGFGRVGAWFSSVRFGLEPDLVVFAKGITSGYVPLGGVIASPRVTEPFWRPDGGVLWRHGYTYSGHAAAAAAAHANLDIIERERLVERGLALEAELAEVLTPLAGHPLVREVRAGTGAVAAVQLEPDAVAEDAGLPERAVLAAREAGVLTRAMVGGALFASPPLIITRSELDELAAGFAAALDAVAADRVPSPAGR